MSNTEEHTIGNYAGSQNQYITDTGNGACIKTAYPGNANGFNKFDDNGPYSGEHEYDNSYKYISPNFNPGVRVWNGVKPEEYHPNLGNTGHSFVPNSNGKLYSVDSPYNSYFTQPINGLHKIHEPNELHKMYEPFGFTRNNTKLIIHLLVIVALIYVVYYLVTNNKKLY